MTQAERKYLGAHLLRTFFEDLDEWKKISHLAGIDSSISQLEYDYALKGTNADIYIPLWASACLSGMDILLNETTRDVVLCYKRFGYVPVRMDGNPPDYIGEQFRFLEYLFRCAVRSEEEVLCDAAEDFIEDYTLSTVDAIGRAVRAQAVHPEILRVIAFAEQCLKGAWPDADRAVLTAFDSWEWQRKPAILPEAPRRFSQASFNDCGGKCKMLSKVQEGCVLGIRPDKDTPYHFSGCPRGAAYRATFLSSRRLRYPMERVGKRGEGKFRRISWEEAERKVAAVIRESHACGPGSRYVMHGAGVCATLFGSGLMKRLLAKDGGYLGYYGTYSAGCAIPALSSMFGTAIVSNNELEILHAKLLILWGHNPASTHFGSAQKRILMQAKELGTRIIVIDPRQSDTALAAADEWIAIRPSTDSALADAMCYVIRERKLYDKKFIDRFCIGFDEEHLPDGIPAGESYFAYLDGAKDGIVKTPEWAEKITGVPAQTIERIAVEYAEARYACILPGLGPQRTLNGEQTYRSIMTLPCLAGSIGKPGGGVITWERPASPQPELPPFENPYPTTIPAFQWWRTLEQPQTLTKERGLKGAEQLDGPVRYIFSIASGMMVNQHSDIHNTLRILQQTDSVRTIVLTDLFMTPSARNADLLLPAPSFFETDNICPPWTGEDYLLYNHAPLSPLFGTKSELDWMTNVSRLLGIEEEFCEGRHCLQDWLRTAWEGFRKRLPGIPEYEEFQARGIITSGSLPPITFRDNIENGKPFDTPSGKIEIFSKAIYDLHSQELRGVPAYAPVEEGPDDPNRSVYPLQLIGYHSRRRCHSIHDQNVWLEELEPPRVWIHPDDAAARGIADGDMVEIFNGRGCVRIPAYVTPRIVQGVAAMCEGVWYHPDKSGTDTRGCMNVLTMSHRASPLGHSNPQHTNLVEIRRAEKGEN